MTGISNGLTIPSSIANGAVTDAPAAMSNWNALLVGLNRALLDGGNGLGMNAFNSQIHNLAAGSLPTDAATVAQISGTFLPITGGTLLGPLAAASGVTAPTQTVGDSTLNAATTAFVQAQLTATLAATLTMYLQKSGGTMTGKLTTFPSSIGGAGLNLPQSVAPTAPANGDLWLTAAGLFAQVAGLTQQLMVAPAVQAWANVTGSRADGTAYTNTTGQPIFVSLSIYSNETAALGTGSVVVGGTTIATGLVGGPYTRNMYYQTSFIVPAGATYRVTIGSGGSIIVWAELR